MAKILSDEDVELVAQRVVKLMAERLAAQVPQPIVASPPSSNPEPEKPQISGRLAYTLKQLSSELGLSPASIYRLDARGLIKSLPGIRHKIYSHAEVQRFLAGDREEWTVHRRIR